jgi:hypothetical protein
MAFDWVKSGGKTDSSKHKDKAKDKDTSKKSGRDRDDDKDKKKDKDKAKDKRKDKGCLCICCCTRWVPKANTTCLFCKNNMHRKVRILYPSPNLSWTDVVLVSNF